MSLNKFHYCIKYINDINHLENGSKQAIQNEINNTSPLVQTRGVNYICIEHDWIFVLGEKQTERMDSRSWGSLCLMVDRRRKGDLNHVGAAEAAARAV